MANVTKLPSAAERAKVLEDKAINLIEQAMGALGEAEEIFQADERIHTAPSPSAQASMVAYAEADNFLEEALKKLGAGMQVVKVTNIRPVTLRDRE